MEIKHRALFGKLGSKMYWNETLLQQKASIHRSNTPQQ